MDERMKLVHTPIRVFRQTMRTFDYPERCYTIWGRRNDSLCIEMDGDHLLVYYLEDDEQYNAKMYKLKEVKEACKYMIRDLAMGLVDQERMLSYFNSELARREALEMETKLFGYDAVGRNSSN